MRIETSTKKVTVEEVLNGLPYSMSKMDVYKHKRDGVFFYSSIEDLMQSTGLEEEEAVETWGRLDKSTVNGKVYAVDFAI